MVWGKPADNFRDLVWNFNYAAGHLWFVYMLVGLYLIMPLLSPWAEKVGRKELQAYLGIWLFTTMIPLFRSWLGGPAPAVYGPTGIPNLAQYPLWGEASWNAYGLFYYLSGFVGYMLLGLYFRKFVGPLSWGKTLSLALPLFLAGFGIGVAGFLHRVAADSGGVFPVSGSVGTIAVWETTWLNDSLGVALMAIAWILLLRKIQSPGPCYRSIVSPVSQAGYGMYLSHMLVLATVSGWLRSTLKLGTEGTLGIWTTPVQIISCATVSFILVAAGCVLIRRIPWLGSKIMG